MEEAFDDILKRNGYKITLPRKEVFKVLQKAESPVRVTDIVRRCESVDKASVYRTIELFTKLDIVRTVPSQWHILYELADSFVPHHHHLVCTNCHATKTIHPEALERLVTNISRRHGFTPAHHHFEITGLCQECSNYQSSE